MTREEAIKVTNGNELAADFVVAFVAYCHLLDDVVDQDKPTPDTRLIKESLTFIESLLVNPWVKERQALLWPLIVTSFNAWLDANEWERNGTDEKKRDADVVKGVYHEVVWFVSYLCGGW